MTEETGARERVVLEEPIKREGAPDITEVFVRRPMPSELEGLSLRDIVDMDSATMMRLLPRITEPQLLMVELATMKSPRDFIAMAAEASGFFLPKALRPVSQPQ